MATTALAIRGRVLDVLQANPFQFTIAATPFDFDSQPSGNLDQTFRVEMESNDVTSFIGTGEEHTDLVHIWVARKQFSDPENTYQRLQADAADIRAAVIADGISNGGDYGIPAAGHGVTIQQQQSGQEYAVLRLTVPVNYEVAG